MADRVFWFSFTESGLSRLQAKSKAGTEPSKQVMEGNVQVETVKYISDRYGRWHNER